MRKLVVSLVSVCCLLATITAVAQPQAGRKKVALLPVTGTNVHPGYLDAARDVLKDHLIDTGQFEVITVPGESGSVEVSPGDALALGRTAGAELVVVTHMVRLGSTGRLRLVAYRIADGTIAHADSIGIAGGPDDLDPALKRLALGMATGKPVSQTAEIDTVTQRESDSLVKQTATKSFGLRLGALFAFNRPKGDDMGALPGIGVFWLYDARSFMAEVTLDYHGGDSGHSFAAGIGGFYPFKKGNFTPYVGMTMAYSTVELGGSGATGLRLQPTLGMLLGRLSTVQILGELGYFINTFGERSGNSYDYPVSGDKYYAHGPTLSLGIGF